MDNLYLLWHFSANVPPLSLGEGVRSIRLLSNYLIRNTPPAENALHLASAAFSYC